MTNNLVQRWKSNEGKKKLETIVRYLKKNISLDKIIGMERFEGRWDIRGVNLTPEFLKEEIRISSRLLDNGKLLLRKKRLKGIDFSLSNISSLQLQECEVEDCKFEHILGKEMNIAASHFTNCGFRNSNMAYSFLNQNIGSDSGSFINVDFIFSNLSECTFYFPIIKFCNFVNCNLKATNFDGSRLENCKFEGDVDSCWFSGYSNFAHKSLFYIFNKVDPRKYPNLMENVDFSNAKLTGVSFRNRVPLDKCVFPQGEKYLFIKNSSKTFLLAKKHIEQYWTGENKRIALHMIDSVYCSKNYLDQEDVFLDKHILIELFGLDFANKFFELLKKSS